MLKSLKNFILTLMLVPLFLSSSVYAIDVFENCGTPPTGTSQICRAKSQDSLQKILKNVINTIFYILGIIAVIMIIIGGIRYTTSNGDSQQIKSAKDTVLYSVIGLVVGLLAFAIVNFVLESLG